MLRRPRPFMCYSSSGITGRCPEALRSTAAR
eukprot:COSAG01_NODE_11691_length_1878_cov_3.060146_1_plen_30_part_10